MWNNYIPFEYYLIRKKQVFKNAINSVILKMYETKKLKEKISRVKKKLKIAYMMKLSFGLNILPISLVAHENAVISKL